jgi:hypothetical protein
MNRMPKKPTARAVLAQCRLLGPADQDEVFRGLSRIIQDRDSDGTRWMTRAEAAEVLDFRDPATVWRWLRQGKLKGNGEKTRKSRICCYSVMTLLLDLAGDALAHLDRDDLKDALRSRLRKIISEDWVIESSCNDLPYEADELHRIRKYLLNYIRQESAGDAHERRYREGELDCCLGKARGLLWRSQRSTEFIANSLKWVGDTLRSLGHRKGAALALLRSARAEICKDYPDLRDLWCDLSDLQDEVKRLTPVP